MGASDSIVASTKFDTFEAGCKSDQIKGTYRAAENGMPETCTYMNQFFMVKNAPNNVYCGEYSNGMTCVYAPNGKVSSKACDLYNKPMPNPYRLVVNQNNYLGKKLC